MVQARIEVDADAGPLLLGEVGARGDREADGLVLVPAEEGHQVWVEARAAREGTAQAGITVVGEVFGEVALQAAGLHRTVLEPP